MGKHRVVAFVAALAVVLVFVATGFRIYKVNANRLSIPIETYGVGQEVALSGAFMYGSSEQTNGYSLAVNAAELMSYNEYVDRYGVSKKKRQHIDEVDDASVVMLEVAVTNDGNTDGYLAVGQWRLVPARANDYYIAGLDLWSKSEKNDLNGFGVLKLVKDTTYTMHIPFVTNTSDEKKYTSVIDDRSFTLYVADAPVSKGIQVDVTAQ